MTTLNDLFLTAMTTTGPLALGLALLLGPLGLPIPTGALLLAAGALARQGILPWAATLGVGLAATLLGDLAGYLLGRAGGGWAERLAKGRADAWQRAQAWFQQRGGLALYLTRVVLTALDVPTNLLAGSSRYPIQRFLAWDVLGRACWLLLYGGLGYLLGSQWQVASQALSRWGGWIAVGAGITAGLFAIARHGARRRRFRTHAAPQRLTTPGEPGCLRRQCESPRPGPRRPASPLTDAGHVLAFYPDLPPPPKQHQEPRPQPATLPGANR